MCEIKCSSAKSLGIGDCDYRFACAGGVLQQGNGFAFSAYVFQPFSGIFLMCS